MLAMAKNGSAHWKKSAVATAIKQQATFSVYVRQ